MAKLLLHGEAVRTTHESEEKFLSSLPRDTSSNYLQLIDLCMTKKIPPSSGFALIKLLIELLQDESNFGYSHLKSQLIGYVPSLQPLWTLFDYYKQYVYSTQLRDYLEGTKENDWQRRWTAVTGLGRLGVRTEEVQNAIVRLLKDKEHKYCVLIFSM